MRSRRSLRGKAALARSNKPAHNCCSHDIMRTAFPWSPQQRTESLPTLLSAARLWLLAGGWETEGVVEGQEEKGDKEEEEEVEEEEKEEEEVN